MNNNITFRRKITIGLALLITHFIFYVLGVTVTRNEMLIEMNARFDEDNTEITLARYVEAREIVLNIKGGDVSRANCMAELGASNMYDDLQACLGRKNCRISSESKIRQFAPEILGEAPIKFTYMKSKNGIRSCTAR